MLRTYRYLLRPTTAQAKQLDYLVWQSRLVYNAALDQRITTYQTTGQGVKYAQQWVHFRDVRRANPATLGQLNASSLQHVLRRLDKAFAAFFRRLKAGENPGFPRFKSCRRFHSLEYTYGDGCKLRQDEHGRRSCYLQNVGEIRLCYHRPIPTEAVIKHVVVKRVAERWYVCLMLELPAPAPQPQPVGGQIGLDMGLKSLVALSTGELIENPRWLREGLAHLRRLHRHGARQVKGSHRQRKTYCRIARLHQQVVNQRADFLHKLSSRLVANNSLIAIEDLSLGFMNRSTQLSMSSYDAGFGLLRHMLHYKAESAGIEVVAVNPANTSQACSRCGQLVLKALSVRVHHCTQCDLRLDRDVNAARNILDLALVSKSLGRSDQALTWAAAPCVA